MFLKGLNRSIQIISYVVTSGGNSFQPGQQPSFNTLLLGKNPDWNYINLFFDRTYHAAASARIIGEGVSPDNPIITMVLHRIFNWLLIT